MFYSIRCRCLENKTYHLYSIVAIISYLGQSKPCFGEFLKNIMNVNACKMMKKKLVQMTCVLNFNLWCSTFERVRGLERHWGE